MAMAPKPTAERTQSATPRRCGVSDMDNNLVDRGERVLPGHFGTTSGDRSDGANPHRSETRARHRRRRPRGQRTERSCPYDRPYVLSALALVAYRSHRFPLEVTNDPAAVGVLPGRPRRGLV